jgi:hypothetical protein
VAEQSTTARGILDLNRAVYDRKEPVMGDIGKPLKHIELEPLEAPISVPEPEKVPA